MIQNLIRKNIKAMEPYASARDEFEGIGKQMIFLDANENPYQNGINRYPDPQQKELKKRIAVLKNIKADSILLGNGSDELLDLMLRAFCEPNEDNIITLPPTYGMYGVLANLNAVENRQVLLLDDFQPDVKSIVSTADSNSKLLFLCSPNNPTGNCFSDDAIISLLEQFKGIVVLDEAYIDFAERESWLNKLKDYPNLVILQTLSKAYGMAGIRLGILYGSSEIIAILNKIKPPYNINELTQEKAFVGIANTAKIKDEVNTIIKERNNLIKGLSTIDFIKYIYPSDANFILIKVDNATMRYNQLIENGIVIRNRSSQPLCNNCLRITVGTPLENEQLIKILQLL